MEIILLLIPLVSLLLDTSSQMPALEKDLASYWKGKGTVEVPDSLFGDPLVGSMRTSVSVIVPFSLPCLPWTTSGWNLVPYFA